MAPLSHAAAAAGRSRAPARHRSRSRYRTDTCPRCFHGATRLGRSLLQLSSPAQSPSLRCQRGANFGRDLEDELAEHFLGAPAIDDLFGTEKDNVSSPLEFFLSVEEVEPLRSRADTQETQASSGFSTADVCLSFDEREIMEQSPRWANASDLNSVADINMLRDALSQSVTDPARKGDVHRCPSDGCMHRCPSDGDIGYASKLPRQASVPREAKLVRSVKEIRAGTAQLAAGWYLFVMMVGDPKHVRLIHETDLVLEGVLAGHTSLVKRDEFVQSWSLCWEASDAAFRHTVLYAGELEYVEGTGVIEWNNRSGHYLPDGKDHARVDLSPSSFRPVDEDES